MLKKMLLGVLITVFALNILIFGINFNEAKPIGYSSSGTPVGGITWENTTRTLENSPYIVVDTVQIPDNVTLIIGPGVTVVSSISKEMFIVQGNLLAIGEINSPIIINGIDDFFYAFGSSAKNAVVVLKYCEITGGGIEGSLFPSNGYGLLNMSRCKIANVPEPCSPNICYIEFSIFREWCSFVVGAGFSETAYLCFFNNVFIGRSYFAADEYYTFKCIGLHVIVHYNSFFENDQVIQAYPGATAIEVNATLNYWGTTNTSIIDSMIYDKKDDITCAGFIEYLPILTEPHPDTPKVSSTIYVDDNNTAGSWDGTFEHPYQNITQGLKHASDNDTIFVLSGTYYENVVVNKTLCLTAENREDTIIDARGIGDVLRIEADNVTVSNFTIRYGDNGIHLSGSYARANHGSTIQSNNITKNRLFGITAIYSTASNFERNIIDDNDYGIELLVIVKTISYRIIR